MSPTNFEDDLGPGGAFCAATRLPSEVARVTLTLDLLLLVPGRHAADQAITSAIRGHGSAPINWRKDSCCVSVDGFNTPGDKGS